MGVVRREGDWRLEKVEEGHYELTHQRELYAKIVTPEFDPGLMGSVGFGLETVYEVDSYAEAEGLFEEHAEGNKPDIFSTVSPPGSPAGGTTDAGSSRSIFDSGDSERTQDPIGSLFEEANLPIGGLGVVLVLAGGITIWNYGIAPDQLVFQFSALLLGVGLLIFAIALLMALAEGPSAAVDFLLTAADKDDSEAGGSSATEDESSRTTTSVPSDRKRELIYDRAGNACEYCDEPTDNPEIHHIESRSDGGTHERSNLMVLCPSCHRKANSGGLSKTQLHEKLRYNRTKTE